MINETLLSIIKRATASNRFHLSAVKYESETNSYVATDGVLLIQLYAGHDPRPADCYFNDWERLKPAKPLPVPAEFYTGTEYKRVANKRGYTKRLFITQSGTMFNADFIKDVYHTLGAGGQWTHSEDDRIYFYETSKGRAFLCRMQGVAMDDFTLVASYHLDSLSDTKAPKVKQTRYWVVLDPHGFPVAVARTEKSALASIKTQPSGSEVVAVPVVQG